MSPFRYAAFRRAGVVVAAVLSVLLGSVCAASATPSSAGPAGVPPPSQDPFYAVPSDVGRYAPGEVISSREIDPIAIVVSLRDKVRAWQVLYRTNDQRGATATVATILVPRAPWEGSGTRPLISYQSATDAVGIDCNPSYTWRSGIFSGPQAGLADPIAVAPALLKGWAVVVADYEGPEGLFTNYAMTAHGVLDGIRATLNFSPAGLDKRTRVGAFGYSGGGYATAAAAEQQGGYAPELNYVGSAAGGIPADLRTVGEFLSGPGSYAAGLAGAAIIGQLKANPSLASLLNDQGKAFVAKYRDACGATLVAENVFRNIQALSAVPDLWHNPRLVEATRENDIGYTVPAEPVYAYHGAVDEVVPYSVAKTLFQQWCTEGAPLTAKTFPFAEHGLGIVQGIGPSFDFLTARFNGQPVSTTCQHSPNS